MQRGTGPTPLPGMSVPRTTSRRRRRIRGTTWIGLVLTAATFLGGELLDGFGDEADGTDEAAVSRVLLSKADLGDGWDEDEDDAEDVTIGLTEQEADCLDVDILQPEVERGTSFFTKGDVTVSFQVGVWRDEEEMRAASEAMARPAFPSCLVGQLQGQEEGDRQDRAYVTLLGRGPTTADPTIDRVSVLYGWSDGAMETAETFQAFKGRTQVVLFAWTPAGADQAFAVELVRRMLARVE